MADVGREPDEDLTAKTMSILKALELERAGGIGDTGQPASTAQPPSNINNLCSFIVSLNRFAEQMPDTRSTAYHDALQALLGDAVLRGTLLSRIQPHAAVAGSVAAAALDVLRAVGTAPAAAAAAAAPAAAAAVLVGDDSGVGADGGGGGAVAMEAAD